MECYNNTMDAVFEDLLAQGNPVGDFSCCVRPLETFSDQAINVGVGGLGEL